MEARTMLCGFGLVSAATLLAASPSHAQCRLCSKPTTSAESAKDGAIALEIEAGLDFDKLVVSGSGEGSATLTPDGRRQVSGSIEALTGRAMVGEARVRGEPGRAVRIDVPDRIRLYSINGSMISIDRIETDLPAMPKLDSAGNLSFRFGGRINVSGDAEGNYRGDLPITADYL